MQSAQQAFEKAVQHFPSWMDIRKRKHKSIGGHYLRSITEEVSGINEAIEDYRKSFFAYNYVGKEDTVIDYVWSSTIGAVDLEHIVLTSPALPITNEAKVFNNNRSTYAYYEDGKLLFDFGMKGDAVQYTLHGKLYTAELKRLHLWNIFDEFALFSGMERQEGERNKALLDRILLTYKHVANSTEIGLKNAIANELSQLVDIDKDDIRIAKAGEANIHKKDKDGIAVSEHIVLNDADVNRGKVWNRNRWDHPFKELVFASHKWDQFIGNKQVGTGYGPSLFVQVAEEMSDNLTDVVISVYKKSNIKIEQYLKSNRREVPIPLVLTKYKDQLSPLDVQYRITGEEVSNISADSIYIEAYTKRSGEMVLPIEDVAIDRYDKEYEIAPGGLLKSGTYKLRFIPKGPYSKAQIKKVILAEGGQTHSLLQEKGGYRLEGDMLVAEASKFYGERTEEFYEAVNIENGLAGMSIRDVAKEGMLRLDVSGIENQYIRHGVKTTMTDITFNNSYVSHEGFSNTSGKWSCKEPRGKLIVEGRMNELELSIEKGNVAITTIVDGKSEFQLSSGAKLFKLSFAEPKDVRVEIEKLENTGDLAISQIRYTHYQINFSLSHGDLIRTPQGIAIPAGGGKRYLSMTIRSYTGFSPVLSYVYVGSSLQHAIYETEEFTTGPDARLSIDSSCSVELVNTSTNEVVSNYSTASRFINNSDEPVYVELDMSILGEIKESAPKIEPTVYKGSSGYYVQIAPKSELSAISLTGELLKMTHRKKLYDVLKKSEQSELFASRQLQGFIVRDGGQEELRRIDKDMISGEANIIKIVGMPDHLEAAFVTDHRNRKEVVGTSYGNFDFMYLYPKESTRYVAYNKEKVLAKRTEGIEIVDLFMPQVPANRLICYRLEKDGLPEGVSVLFAGDVEWSIGKKPIHITVEESAMAEQFSVDSVTIPHRFIVSDYMVLDSTITDKEVSFHLPEYVLDIPEGFELITRTELSDMEEGYIKNDGFNKLRMARANRIVSLKKEDGSIIDEGSYELYKEEGIIYWKESSLAGERFSVVYEYEAPLYLHASNIDTLYDLVGYELESMEFLYEIVYQGISSSMMLRKEDRDQLAKGDFRIVQSSNPMMEVTLVEDSAIQINKLYKTYPSNKVFVNPGYYYVSQKEWYKYANPEEAEVNANIGIRFFEEERLNDEILLSQASSNYMKNTNMLSDDLRTICELDLVGNDILHANSIRKLTASDTYNMWRLFETDLSFDNGYNGKGLRLSQHSPHGYISMDISEYAKAGQRLSAFAEETLAVYLAVQRDGGNYERTLGEELLLLERTGDFVHYTFKEDVKAVLVVTGSGVIDDLICTNAGTPMVDVHTKNIHKAGFAIQEEQSDYNKVLLFDPYHNTFERTEMDSGGVRTATSMTWGLTKVHDYKSSWHDALKSRVLVAKDEYLKTEDLSGVIHLPAFRLNKREGIKNIHVVVNQILFDHMKGFDISALTGDAPDGDFVPVATETGTNHMVISGPRLSDYMKVVITMPKNHVIENVEVYAEYAETGNQIAIAHYTSGSFTTKLYDAGDADHYELERVLLDAASFGNSRLSVRGAKQNAEDLVWTEWKPVSLDKKGNVTNEVRFKDYEYFQFKGELGNEEDRINIYRFELGVVR